MKKQKGYLEARNKCRLKNVRTIPDGMRNTDQEDASNLSLEALMQKEENDLGKPARCLTPL